MASRVEPLKQDAEVNNWKEIFEQTTETTWTEKKTSHYSSEGRLNSFENGKCNSVSS